MNNIEEMRSKLEELKPALKDNFKVKSIGFFGSYVRGEQKRSSDLDVEVVDRRDARKYE